MEALLDTIVMGAGVAQIPSENVITDPTQGCLATRARVPWPVILAFFVATVLTCAMVIYWVVLAIYLCGAVTRPRLSKEQIKAIKKQTPNDYLTWMLQAARETGFYTDELKNLREWSFGFQHGWQHPGLTRNGTHMGDMGVEQHFPQEKAGSLVLRTNSAWVLQQATGKEA